MTRYAVQARYPGPAEQVTENEYLLALDHARHVVRWDEALILEP